MRITCPQCGFFREVPDSKAPVTPTMATCPKCRHRFRFRPQPTSAAEESFVAAEPGVSDMDPAKIQDLFFRRLYINYSESVKPSHVKIERMDGGWKMSVSYEVRRPLVGNLDVIGKFDASEPLTRRAPE